MYSQFLHLFTLVCLLTQTNAQFNYLGAADGPGVISGSFLENFRGAGSNANYEMVNIADAASRIRRMFQKNVPPSASTGFQTRYVAQGTPYGNTQFSVYQPGYGGPYAGRVNRNFDYNIGNAPASPYDSYRPPAPWVNVGGYSNVGTSASETPLGDDHLEWVSATGERRRLTYKEVGQLIITAIESMRPSMAGGGYTDYTKKYGGESVGPPAPGYTRLPVIPESGYTRWSTEVANGGDTRIYGSGQAEVPSVAPHDGYEQRPTEIPGNGYTRLPSVTPSGGYTGVTINGRSDTPLKTEGRTLVSHLAKDPTSTGIPGAPPVTRPVVELPEARPVVGPPVTGSVVGPAVTRPVAGPPATGPIAGPPVTGPVVGPPATGPIAGPPVTEPVAGPPATGSVVGPAVTRPVAVPPATGPIAGPPVTEPVAGPPATGSVVGPAVTRPVAGPPATGPIAGPPVTGPVVGPPVTGPVVGPPVTGPIAGPPATGPIAGPPVTEPVAVPPATGPIAGPPVTEPVAGPPATGPIAGPPVTGPVVGPLVPGPVVGPPVTGPIAGPPATGPIAGPPIAGPIIGPPVTEPVAGPPVTEPVAGPPETGVSEGI